MKHSLREKTKEKAHEAVWSVLPIMLIVLLLAFTIAPIPTGILAQFLLGGILVIGGMIFFTMGAELSMTPMGERVGGSLLRTKK